MANLVKEYFRPISLGKEVSEPAANSHRFRVHSCLQPRTNIEHSSSDFSARNAAEAGLPPSASTTGREEPPLLPILQLLDGVPHQPGDSRAYPHGRAALPMPRLRQGFRTEHHPGATRADPSAPQHGLCVPHLPTTVRLQA